MNITESTRQWLRKAPCIDLDNRFNINHLGHQTVEYSVTLSAESHREDVLGYDLCTASVLFSARMPYGEALAANIAASDFFSELSAWIRAANKNHDRPVIDGYETVSVTAANAGMIVQANANTARYQLQIQLKLEEV